MAETPEERGARVEHESLTACGPRDEQEHDLGTGRAADIQIFAPRFYAFRTAGAHGPRTFAEADQIGNEDSENRQVNRRRVEALQRGMSQEFKLEPVNFEGTNVANIVTEKLALPEAVRAWFLGPDKLVVLLSPGQCPHIVAKDVCENDQLVSKLSVRGTVSCIAGQAVKGEHVWAGVDGNEAAAIELGKPTLVRAKAPYGSWEREKDALSTNLSMQVSRELNAEPLGTFTVESGTFTDPRTEEILALLAPGTLERQAALGYRNLYRSTDEIDLEVVEYRVAAVTKQMAKVTMPQHVINLRTLLAIGLSMPGDADVLAALRPKQEQLVSDLLERGKRDEDTFVLGAMIIEGMAVNVEPSPAHQRFVETFGPIVASGELDGDRVQQHFERVFAKTKHADALAAHHEKEEGAREQKQADAEREEENDSLWQELQRSGDQIATLNYGIPFITKYFHDAQNKRAVRRMIDHRRLLLAESFCPARASFIKHVGADELRRRAREHCESEPPTHAGIGGEDVALTKECRQVFETVCK